MMMMMMVMMIHLLYEALRVYEKGPTFSQMHQKNHNFLMKKQSLQLSNNFARSTVRYKRLLLQTLYAWWVLKRKLPKYNPLTTHLYILTVVATQAID